MRARAAGAPDGRAFAPPCAHAALQTAVRPLAPKKKMDKLLAQAAAELAAAERAKQEVERRVADAQRRRQLAAREADDASRKCDALVCDVLLLKLKNVCCCTEQSKRKQRYGRSRHS